MLSTLIVWSIFKRGKSHFTATTLKVVATFKSLYTAIVLKNNGEQYGLKSFVTIFGGTIVITINVTVRTTYNLFLR